MPVFDAEGMVANYAASQATVRLSGEECCRAGGGPHHLETAKPPQRIAEVWRSVELGRSLLDKRWVQGV